MTKIEQAKEDKKVFMQELRERRKLAKQLVNDEIEANNELINKVRWVFPDMSWISILFVNAQMRNVWFDWLPWLDMKTYQWRKDNWFCVIHWQKSQVHWVTRVDIWEDDEKILYPKSYALFHRSQVEPIQ